MQSLYRGHRFPPEIISYAVWLYPRFALSFRDVEDLLAERGITVSYEAIRYWCLKVGETYALSLRRKQGRLGRRHLKAAHYRLLRDLAFADWREVSCVG